MSETVREYDGASIRVSYDPVRCIHAAECVRGLPAVFAPGRRPWVDPSRAAADAVAAVVARCPTGALAYARLDGDAPEMPAPANRITVSVDGPLFIRGRIVIRHADGGSREEKRVAMCRCGASRHKPLCDGSHQAASFRDAGDVARLGETAAVPDGALEVAPRSNGPVVVRGRFTLVDGLGIERGEFEKATFCRCGASHTKPFCDGSHTATGFTAD